MAAGGGDDRAERAFGAVCVLATAFVVYASLVPLAYTAQPLSIALQQFLRPPLASIGALDRADWLANLLLFVPLSFCGLAALARSRNPFARASRAAAVIAGFALLAVTIEVAQLWFPPRSVSASDLIAELAGIVLGALAWAAIGPRTLRVTRPLFFDGKSGRKVLALLFVVGYVGLALFPFDLVLSIDEVRAKLAAGTIGWWTAPSACSNYSLCIAAASALFVAALAFGIACRLLGAHDGRAGSARAVVLGVVVAVAIELAQLLLVSGVAQGSSVVVRAAGIAIGYRLFGQLRRVVDVLRERPLSRPVLATMAIGYVVALVLANRLVTTQWLSLDEAVAKLGELPAVPFYYHYFVSEQRALASAIVHLAMYAPIGAWLAVARRGRAGRATAAWAAALVALVVEGAKLFAGLQADPTDLLLAAIAGYVAYALVCWVLDWHDRARQGISPGVLPPFTFGPLTPYGFVLALAAVLAVLAYPGPRTLLALTLGVYALALSREPGIWLVVVPALLPVLDLAQWTGALFLDEFDLFVMTTLAVLCFRSPREGAAHWPAPLALALAVAMLLVLIAFVRGLAPLFPLDGDTFASVHSPANAWRVGRAMLWCAALVLLVRRWSDGPERDLMRWSRGMTIGLALVGVVMIWERTTFAGWTDFGIEYRAVGALAAASTAGAQTESFLAAAIPFAMLLASTTASTAWRTIALVALLLSAYAITATVSRAAIVAAGAAVLLFSVGLALRIPLSVRARRSLAYMFPGTVLLLGIAALVTGERFAQATGDFAARRAHWQRLVDPSEERLADTLIGHGLGSYPRVFFWTAAPDERPSLFSYRQEGERAFVRIAPGRATFLDQIVDVEPGMRYELAALVRTAVPGAAVVVRLCEKWILYSVRCDDLRLQPATPNLWEAMRVPLRVRAAPPSVLARPTEKLSLSIAPGSRGVVDVTGLRLVDAWGRDRVRNGSFTRLGDHWLVSAGDHWAWNTFSMFVEVVFEQGWLSLVALVAALAYAFTAVGRRATEGDLVASAFAAALVGYLVPSLFDALIDEPRMRLLLGLLVALPLLRGERAVEFGAPAESVA